VGTFTAESIGDGAKVLLHEGAGRKITRNHCGQLSLHYPNALDSLEQGNCTDGIVRVWNKDESQSTKYTLDQYEQQYK